LAALTTLKGYFSFAPSKEFKISSISFKILKYVGVFLLGCSILSTGKQFFGEPIICKPLALPPNLFTTFCFAYGTTTNKMNVRMEELPESYAHHGISIEKDGEEILHNYYQWVPFVLFFQAVLCFLPGCLWTYFEGGKLSKLLAKISRDPLIETPLEEQVEGLSNFLASNPKWYCRYANWRLLCVFSTLFVAVLQAYVLDLTFDHQFITMGLDLLNASEGWEHHRIVEDVFPLVTNCKMKYVGPTGKPLEDSGMCVLAINILNQKIFAVTYFLLLGILIYTTLVVFYEIVLMCMPSARYFMLRGRVTLPSQALSRVNKHINYGTYTLLMLISQNLDSSQFETMVTLLAEKIGMNDFYPNSINMPHDRSDCYPMSMNAPPAPTKVYPDVFGMKNKQADSLGLRSRPRLMSE